MIKKMLTAGFVILGIAAGAQAQTIKVEFSHFAGKQYHYILDSGDKKDTIATGKLNAAGKATLVIPAAKKGYAGMSHFMFAGEGGLDFIVNNENFSVSCTEEQPSFENVKYTGSPENDFLNNKLAQQKSILEKAGLMQYALTAYKKEDALYPVFEKEKANQSQVFTTLKNQTAQSPLYAARFAEIYDFLMAIGSTLDLTEEAKANEANVFFKDKLDMQVLYTSSVWSPAIESWMQLQQNMIKDDAAWLADTKQILSRIKSNKTYTAFTEKAVSLFVKAGKDNLSKSISDYAAKSGRLEKPGKNLVKVMTGAADGSQAPVLKTATGKKTVKSKTLLFFYESGCNNCENEIHQLIGNYSIVKERGYEVITVAADLTKDAGDGHNHEFPWKEQLCDYKGFAGENFKNYGVIGTPTIFIIDEKGKIVGRYPRLIDTGILQ